MKKETRATHQPRVKLPPGNESLVDPVYRSVKFTFPDIDAARTPQARREGFDYTRDSNPTTRQLELLSSELQGRDDGVCVSTGMAAVWLSALGNLSAGDRVVFLRRVLQAYPGHDQTALSAVRNQLLDAQCS